MTSAAQSMRRLRAKRRAAGKCVRCGRPHRGEPCITCGGEAAQKYRQKRADGKCARCSQPSPNKSQCPSCTKVQIQRNAQIRQEVLDAYGAKCICCGETEKGFLTLDHVNGRKNVQPKGTGAYFEAKKGGYPPTFQILCFNCNLGRELRPQRICPHQEKPRV